MKLSKALYFGDFVAIPVVILWLGVAAVQQEGFTGAGLWMIAFLAGVAVWTFVEYAVHRWIYHAVPFFEKFHDAHHEDPKALIGVPSFISSGIILAVFFVPLWLTIGIVLAGGFTSGSLLGYAGYMLVHHASHHWTLKPGGMLYRARVQHMAHHYHNTPGNYGVVTSFWDHVFSTNVDRRRRVVET
ncbi:MAG TPA: sterol desaturase family protein [Roseiarcus sp.]|jgi:sterol desaturase/sphingolipid hydroxylase (fatty acid hydroxylase superfamily)